MRELAAASIVVLIGLAGAHLYVFTLYRRRVFAYFACAWFVNLLYILLEAGVSRAGGARESADLLVSIMTIISTAFFTMALFDLRQTSPRRRMQIVVVMVGIVAVFALVAILAPGRLASFRSEVGMAGIALVTAFTLAGLGRTFATMPAETLLGIVRNKRQRYEWADSSQDAALPESVGRISSRGPASPSVRRVLNFAKVALSLSFFVYAALQPLYPLRPILEEFGKEIFFVLFCIGLSVKIIHGSALPMLVLGELRSTSDALRARSVAEEIGVLTASIEHDIKSPLGLIYKEVDIIKKKFQHVPGLGERLNQLLPHADRIRAAASVIAATREAVEHFDRFAEEMNAISVVRAAAAAVKKLDRLGDIRLPMSHSRSEIMVFCEKASLTQAFVNLINNGVEACRARGDGKPPVIEITCTLNRDHECCEIEIKDQGIGIPPDRIANVGNAFYSTKKTGHGQNRGIGVFMASRVIRLHGGELRYFSDGRSYTTALVTLPLADRRKGAYA